MKRTLILAAIMMVVTIWVLPANLMAQDEGGQCYFQASEDVYLQIYHIGSEGIERRIIWRGHLSAGDTKAFNSPNGQVGYATTDNPEDPWDESEAECINGEAIDIP
jgi:hypothetical protein